MSGPVKPAAVKLAFCSGTGDLNRSLIERLRSIYPELPLWVVSDFPPDASDLKWLPWHQNRSLRLNLEKTRAALRGRSIRLAAVMLAPNVPFRRMRLAALLLSPRGFMAFNENLDHFMLRPRSLPAMARHVVWRIGNYLREKMGADSFFRGVDRQSSPQSVAEKGCLSPFFPETTSSLPGKPQSEKPRVLILSPYLPFPLSHGGAVRMYNLMRRAAQDFDQILIAFGDEVPPQVLEICVEVTLVSRVGRHEYPSTGRPDTVEEFDSPAFHAAVRQAVAKWKPAVAQLEFTQMAQYASDCRPAKTILVEHDITFDLYEQRLGLADDWEVAYQLKLWRRFEQDAWKRVDRVVTMSEKDRRLVGERAVVIANGVDLERFRPVAAEPEPRRILFIGSFAHLPNLLALEFFLNRVWPSLNDVTLHIISGARHEYFLDFYRERVKVDLAQPRIELEGFVSDVRPAYIRATVVVAPLTASAGTNIKVLEAMAMGKAVVSTPAGVNGLDLSPGRDILVTGDMAAAINDLLDHPGRRHAIEQAARDTVERDFGWDPIARRQAELYRTCASLSSTTTS
ncbi:MAG TPA: glycosyltransferase [Bryobacteraceae bacterium]|nr:glycosyltransferase [Bryobacteraceae bacterium]